MRIAKILLLVTFLFSVALISCGPGYKTGDRQVYKLKNHNDLTMVKKSKLQYELSRARYKEQHKRNVEFWKKQMKRRYKP